MRTFPAAFLLVIGLSPLGVAQSKDTSCHIHPPGSTPDNPVDIIGPYASVGECERERRRRLGALGRCHCRADFTPGWYPSEPIGRPASDPSELL